MSWYSKPLTFILELWESFKAKPDAERKKILATLAVSGAVTTFLYAYWRNERQKRIDTLNDALDSFYFSHSYSEAREKFLSALSGSELEEGDDYHLYSAKIDNTARVDTYIDFVYLPGVAATNTESSEEKSHTHKLSLFIHMSGVHGVEGYVGSAVQTKLLLSSEFQQLFAAGNEKVAAEGRPSFLFIHAVNPTGMALNRRFTQDNIDLNRNFFDEERFHKEEGGLGNEHYEAVADMDSTDTFRANEAFNALKFMTSPQRMPSFYRDDVLFYTEAASMIAKHGMNALSKAIVSGQYFDEKGLFFGGSFLAPELVTLKHYFDEIFPQFTEGRKADKADWSKVTILDVHSGLGPRGLDTLILMCQPHADEMHEMFVGDAEYLKLDRIQCMAAAVASGEMGVALGGSKFDAYTMYKHAFGSVKKGILQDIFGYALIAAPGSSPEQVAQTKWDCEHCLAVTQEFGTLAGLYVFKALRNENMAFWHRDVNDVRHSEEFYGRGMDVRSAFYCFEDPYWKQSVLFNGHRLFTKLLNL